LLLIGCLNTEGTLNIEGKVLDEYTKKGVPNRVVFINSFVLADSKPISTNVGRFYTDSAGCFSYTMKKVKGSYSYNFIFTGDSIYSFSNQEVYLTQLQENSKFLYFYLSKLANFTIKIEKCSKSPLTEKLYVSWKTDGVDGKTLYPHKLINYGNKPEFEFKWTGENVKSVIETKVLANKKTIICWELVGNRSKKEIYDTIYCERDVKNSFNFKY